jgi:hypothetical protein
MKIKKTKTTQSIRCDIPVDYGQYWGGDDFWLPENEIYTLVIDYPFHKEARYDIKTKKGMGLAGLIKQIYKCYIKKYKSAEKDDNDGYWHGIGDLVIEGIQVNHKSKIIRLSVGS